MINPDIIDLLAVASEHPSTVEFKTMRQTVATSFGEIWRMVMQVVAALSTERHGEPIAGLLSPSPEAIACAVGCLKAGIDFVSLQLPGRGQQPAEYLEQVLQVMRLSGATRLVVAQEYIGLIEAFAPALMPSVVTAEALVARGDPTTHHDRVPGRLVQFSSGTTGTPKGVVLTTGNIGASVAATIEALGVRPGDRSCQWIPLSHDMGLIGGLFTAWAGAQQRFLGSARGHYVCLSPERFMARPMAWLEECAASGATITAAPTFAYQVIARQLRDAPKLDLRNLRVALVGAEPVLPQTLRDFAQAARPHGFEERALCPAYGLAEATLAVALVPPTETWSTVQMTIDGETRDYVSCGRPLPCVEVRAPRGTPGPIVVTGAAVSREYLPMREAREDGLLDTKDLGAYIGADLVVTGRSDDMLCLGGRNMYAWELERQASLIPGVRAGNCMVVADGEGRYAVLFEAAESERSQLRELMFQVRGKLVSFAGIGPSTIGCLPRGGVPKTPSGKLQRRKVAVDLSAFVARCTMHQRF